MGVMLLSLVVDTYYAVLAAYSREVREKFCEVG
jgi:hypothetical protein